MNDVDTRVVQMQFDNAAFEKNVRQTIKSLESLENALQLDGASSGLDTVAKAAPKTAKALDAISESCDQIEVSFSSAEVIMATVLYRMTNLAINTGKKMASAIWSPIFEGGKNRALNIESAKFQLEGLGVAWNSISDDINYGVQGTAYGLDAAAKVASQLVASNVSIGDDMRNTLRAISGVAAMTNSSYEEIGNIFTTVASNGKLMTMQLRQLSARGLNASATLAKAMDTTEEAINDMVSKGKIGFQEFADAMDDAFGEHAKSANDTFTGALSNVKAALSRIGAEFESPKFEMLRNIFNDLIPIINNIKTALAPVYTIYSMLTSQVANTVGNLLKSEEFIDAILNIIIDIRSWLKPILVAFSKVVGFQPDLENFAKSLNIFLEKFQLYGDNAVKVEHIFTALFNAISIFITGIKAALNILTPVAKLIAGILGVAVDKTDDLATIINKSTPALKRVITILGEIMRLGLEALLDKIKNFVSNITFQDIINGLSVIAGIIASAIPIIINIGRLIAKVFISVGQFLPKIISWVSNLIDLFTIGIGAIGGFFSGLFGGKTTTTLSVETEGTDNIKSWEDVSETWDDITEKAPGVQKAVTETSKATRKAKQSINDASSSVSKIGNQFDELADSANESADKIDKVGHKVSETVTKIVDKSDSSNTIKGTHIIMNPISVFLQGMLDSLNMSDTIIGKVVMGIANFLDKIVSGIASLFGEFASKIEPLAKELVQWLKHNWWLVLIGIRVSLVGSVIISIIKVISGIGTALSSFGGNAQSEKLKSLAIVIASIGGILLELALISKYVDIEDFEAVIKVIEKAIKVILKMVLFISVVLALKSLFESLPSVLQAIGKASPKVIKPQKNITGSLAAMASFLMSVALMFAVLEGSMYFLTHYMDEDELKRGGIAVAQILLALGAFIFIVSGAVKLSGISTGAKQSGTFLKWENEVYDTLGGVNRLLLSLSVALLSTIGAIYVLGSIPSDVLEQGEEHILKIAIGLGALIAALIFISGSIDKQSVNMMGVEKAFHLGSNANGLASIANMIKNLAGIVLVLVGSIIALGAVETEYPGILEEGEKHLMNIGIGLAAFLGVVGLISALFLRNQNAAGAFNTAISSMKAILLSMSVLMLAIGGMFLILSQVKWEEFNETSIALLSVTVGSIIGMIIALTVLANIAKNSRSTTKVIITAMGSIALVLLSIAGLFFVLNYIDWDSFGGIGIASISIALAAVIGLIIALGAVVSTIKTAKATQRFKEVVITAMASISAALLAIGGMFALMNIVDWSSFGGIGIASISIALAAVIGLIIALGMLVKTITTEKAAKRFQEVVISAMASISAVLLAIGGMFALMGTVDWGNMTGSIGYFIGAIVLVGLIMAGLITMSKLVNDPAAILASALAITVSCIGIFIAIGAMFDILDGINWEAMSAATPFLIGVSIALGVILVITTILAAIGPGALMAMGAILAIDLLFVAIGGMALMMASAFEKITGAINQLTTIDWSTIDTVTNGIVQIFSAFAAAGEMGLKVLVFLPLLALGLMMIAPAIAALAALDPSMFEQATESLKSFFMMINETIVANPEITTALLLLALVFPVLAIAITVGVAALVIAGIGLLLFAATLIGVGLLMQLGGDYIKAGFEKLIQVLGELGMMIFDNLSDITMGAAALIIFGTELILAGTFLTVGGLLFTIGAGLMWGGAVMMSNALPLMMEAMTNTSPDDIMAISGMLSMLGLNLLTGGLMLSIGSVLFLVGSGLFLLATTAFLKGSKNFQKASIFISLAATTLMTTFQMVVTTTSSILIDLANQGPLWYEAGFNIVEGLGNGIVDGAGSVISNIADTANDIIDTFCDILGIHSPSDVFYALGWNTLAGFCEAIEDGESVTEAAMSTLGGWIQDKFGIEMGDAGEDGASALFNGFKNMLSDLLPDFEDIAATLGFGTGDLYSSGVIAGMDRGLMALQSQRDALAANIASQYASGDIKGARKTQELINQLDAQIAQYKKDSHYGKESADDWRTSLGIGGGGGSSIGSNGTSSDLASTISGGSGGGSGINDRSKTSIGGSTNINSNNTYNFTQNNYSPESLSRTDIYTQTKNQLDTWYGLVRANPNPV